MLDVGDTAPTFTVPMAHPDQAGDRGAYTGEHVEPFALDDALDEGPVVLAFIPGVYSRTCTQELCELRDWRAELGELEAAVYGVSVDSPWSQLAFIDEYDLSYPLLSGFNSDLIADFGLRVEEGPLAGIAQRAVLVVGPDGTVTYRWHVTEPGVLPDLDAVEAAVDAAAG